MSENEELHGDESYVTEQEQEAAQEASEIGGSPGAAYEGDESERALAEGGQGESEGFELAEQELVENATHEADASPDPTHLAGREEAADQADPAYGEADSERLEDA